MKLTPKQSRFVDEYLVDLNASAAARRAGYSARTADAIGRENLRKPTVAGAIAERKQSRVERTQIDSDWVLRTLAAEKSADLADIYSDNGALLPIREWPQVWRCGLVVGVEAIEEYQSIDGVRQSVGIVRKVRLSDRIKHIELIGKHVDVQAFREQRALTGPNGEPLTLMSVDLSNATIEQLRAIAGLRLLNASG